MIVRDPAPALDKVNDKQDFPISQQDRIWLVVRPRN